jgi:hypothetical protein
MYQVDGLTCEVEARDDAGSSDTVTLQSGNTTGNQIVLTNPVMTQNALDGLYTQLQDTNFYPFSLDWFGDPSVEVGDWIEIVDAAGNKFKTPNLLFALTFNGSLTATSKADTTVTANSNFSYVNTNNKRIIRDLRARIDASGHKITDGTEAPENPKLGDIWFAKDGPDTIIRIWTLNPDTGEAYWKDEVSTKTTSDIAEQIDEIMKQLKADEDDLAEKMAANDAAQSELNGKLDDNAASISQVKQETADAVADVTASVKQAQDDTAKAVSQADAAATDATNALTTAQDAHATSVDAKTVATGAEDAANKAVSQAADAQADAASAVTAAKTAGDDATSALANAGTALTQASDALKAGQDAQSSVAKVQTNLDTAKGELSASITEVTDASSVNLIIPETKTATIGAGGWGERDLGKFTSEYTSDGTYTMQFDLVCPELEGPTLPTDIGVRVLFTNGWGSDNEDQADIGSPSYISNRDAWTVTKLTAGWRLRRTFTFTLPDSGALRASAHLVYANKAMARTITSSNGIIVKGAVLTQTAIDAMAQGDDFQNQITTNKVAISANTDAIKLKADQTAVDILNHTTQQNSADLKLTAKEAELKTTQQNVDTLSGTVKTQGVTLTETAEALKTKAEASEVNTLTGQYNDLKSETEQSAAKTTEILTAVQTAVQEGGRNLLVGTFDSTFNYGSNAGATIAVEEGDNGEKVLHVVSPVNGAGVYVLPATIWKNVDVVPGDYTVAVDVKGAAESLAIGLEDAAAPTHTLTTDWKRYTATAPITIGHSLVLYGIGDFYVRLIKIEQGPLATPWSPAPEDVADAATLAKLSEQTNTLTKTASDTTAKLTTVESTANGAQTLANTAKQTADTNTATIAQVKSTAEGTQTQVNSIVSDANGTKQTLTHVQTTVQNGGRNFFSVTNWSDNHYVSTELVHATSVKLQLTPNSKYTASTDIPVRGNLQDIFIGPTDFVPSSNVNGFAEGKPLAFDTDETGIVVIVDRNTASIIAGEAHVKIEAGGLATAWSPAPEDLATTAQVHTVETTLTKSLDTISDAQGNLSTDLQTANAKLTTVESTANGAQTLASQTATNLLQKVAKGDLITELNLEAGSALIKSNKIYLDSATVAFSGAAIIPSAAIMSLDATKITTGTLDASKATIINLNADSIVSGSIDTEKVTLKNLSASTIVSGELDASKVTVSNLSASNIIGGTLDANLVTVKDLSASSITSGTLNAGLLNVINLNADSITTGTLSGANLSMNLNTGEVLFTSGAITGTGMNMNLDSGVIDFTQGRFHDDAGTIDLNVDDGYIATSSGDSQMVLSQGKLLLTQKNIFDSYSATPYLQIANNVAGDSLASASIIGRDSVTVCNSANTGSIISMGVETLAGLFAGKATDGWKMTKVGGADRGVIISGGKMSGGALGDHSPSIVVGCDSSGGGKGRDRISIGASYVHIPSTYSRTISGSANVHVASDGALVRSTSAAKYKTDILRTTSSAIGHKLLGIQTATWIDKADQARYASDPNHYERPSRNFGMIADDLDAAGIPELVTYVDGEIEGINYDRIGPALVPVIRELNDKVNQLEALYNAIKNDKLTA